MAAAGLAGGTFFVASGIVFYATFECFAGYQAGLSRSIVPTLMSVGWATYLLGQAARGFGVVHIMTLDVPSGWDIAEELISCAEKVKSANDTMNGFTGFFSLVAWLSAVAACAAARRQPLPLGSNAAAATKVMALVDE